MSQYLILWFCTQHQNVAFMITKMQSYVPSMIKGDYMTTSPKYHIVNATSHISYKHISNMVRRDYSCKRYSPESNKTHGNFTKCHVSQFFAMCSNQILPHASLLIQGTQARKPNLCHLAQVLKKLHKLGKPPRYLGV